MPISIANWGVELAFIRTRVGTEFQVADLLENNHDDESACRCFGTYGYFDIVAVRTISKLTTPNLVLLRRNIRESAPFRFFAGGDAKSKQGFHDCLDNWLVGILTLAKIQPRIAQRYGGRARQIVAKRLLKEFPEAWVFFGLGFSDLLISAGGDNLPELLSKITDCRRLRDPDDKSSPLFSKTTTMPLVSCELVHRPKNYDRLKGSVEPVITAVCEPGAERRVASALKRGMYVRNVYGKSDFLMAWENPVPVGDMAKFLSQFRRLWGERGMVSKTTTYLETKAEVLSASDVGNGSVKSERLEHDGSTAEVMTAAEERKLFRQLTRVEPHSLRGALSDLTLRLTACLRDFQVGDHYRDMQNVLAFLGDLTENLKNGDFQKKAEARFTGERVADLVRAAINQRYAALEFHPETIAHSHVPVLCDIRVAVAAATCVPHFIFNRLLPGRKASETWAGFVIFGNPASPQHLDYDVIGLPAGSLFSPIREWWKATHEVAHAVYRALAVYEAIPRRLKVFVEGAMAETGFSAYHLVNELFANWFDWKYVFQQDTELFLRLIWGSWRDFPVVYDSRTQYLARSFIVFIGPKRSEARRLLKMRRQEGILPWLEQEWGKFLNILCSAGMAKYVNEIEAKERANVFDIAIPGLAVIEFFESHFEKACGAGGLEKRLHPQYPHLARDVQRLMDGKFIEEIIPDPCRLHIELLRVLGRNQPKLCTEVAFMFSLEHSYMANRDG